MASVNWSQQQLLFVPSSASISSISRILQTIAKHTRIAVETARSAECLHTAGYLSHLVTCRLIVDPVWDSRLRDEAQSRETVNEEELNKFVLDNNAICRPGDRSGVEDERQFANRILGAVTDCQDCFHLAVVSQEVLACGVQGIVPGKDVRGAVMAKIDLEKQTAAVFTVEEMKRYDPELDAVSDKIEVDQSLSDNPISDRSVTERQGPGNASAAIDRLAPLTELLNLQLALAIHKPLSDFQAISFPSDAVNALNRANAQFTVLQAHFQATWNFLTQKLSDMRDVKDSHLSAMRQIMDSVGDINRERDTVHTQLQGLAEKLVTEFEVLRKQVEMKVSAANQLATELATVRAGGGVKPKPMNILSVSNGGESATVELLSRKHYNLWVCVEILGEAGVRTEQAAVQVGRQSIPISPLPLGEYTILIKDWQGLKSLSDPFEFSAMHSDYTQTMIYAETVNIQDVEEVLGPQVSLMLQRLAVAWKNPDHSSIAPFIQTVLDHGIFGEQFVYELLCKSGCSFYREYISQMSA